MVTSILSCSTHIESKIRKANTVFFFIKRNTAATQIRVRLNLYKSMLLPSLSFACFCFSLSRPSSNLLENFLKRVLKWVCREYHSTNKALLLKCNLLRSLCSSNQRTYSSYQNIFTKCASRG